MTVLLAATAMLLTPPGEAAAETVAGVTSGALSVESSGAARYAVPIDVPPGVAGMEPGLSLVYSSGGGNGLLGVGWSLAGLSTIHRCAQTIAQDGIKGGVNLDAEDRFCLDGQRLIAIAGADGGDGTEYRTEIDGFARIFSDGTAGTGPASFTVETKSGRILEYGVTADSRLEEDGGVTVRFWALNRVADRLGNYMDLVYDDDTLGQTFKIARIDYAGNTAEGTTPQSEVRFVYESRPDLRVHYHAGSRLETVERLQRVETWTDGALVRRYELAYHDDTVTGLSRLSSVTECDAGTQCLAPITFDWEAEAEGFVEDTGFALPSDSGTLGGRSRFSDLNGDGLLDYLYGYGSTRKAWLNTGSGWEESLAFQPPAAFLNTSNRRLGNLVDVNGDGLQDFVQAFSGQTTWLNTGTGWEVSAEYQPPFNTSYDATLTYYEEVCRNTGREGNEKCSWQTRSITANRALGSFVELNGDGLVDFAYAYAVDGTSTRRAWLNTGSGWVEDTALVPPGDTVHHDSYYGTIKQSRSGPGKKISAANGTRDIGTFLDLNGDGRADLLQAYGSTNRVWLNKPGGWEEASGFAPPFRIGYATTGSYPTYNCRWSTAADNMECSLTSASFTYSRSYFGSFADINGDGLVDRLQASRIGNSIVRKVWLNSGAGWVEDPGYEPPVRNYLAHSSAPNGQIEAQLTDVNGDGLPDYVQSYASARTTWLNTGTGWLESPAHQVPVDLGFYSPLAAGGGTARGALLDIDSDARLDVLQVHGSTRGAWLATYGAVGQITAITDSLGRSTTIDYAPLTDAGVYTKGAGAVFPEVDLQLPLHVVREVSTDDGIGGQARTTYGYESLRAHAQGRGVLGFARMTAVVQQTGIETVTDYRQDFPFIGGVDASETRLADGTLVRSLANSWAEILLNGDLTTFPHVAEATAEGYEINDGPGNLPVTTSTTSTLYDAFGNPVQVTASTSGGGETFTSITASDFTNDTLSWLIGQLDRSQVTNTLPDSTTETRVAAFDYNATNGLLIQEVIEPDKPAFRLTTDYGHDGFGNLTSETINGDGIVARTTSTEFSTDGRFAERIVNDLGHDQTQDFDARFGTVTSLTGPNLITTTWDYDGFGRKTREVRADGTETRWSYELCISQCALGGVYAVTQQDFNSASQTPISARVLESFDLLNRSFQSETEGFDGTKVFVDTEFNERGEVVAATRPYFEGAAAGAIQRATSTYDIVGRVLTITQPDQGLESVSYDGLSITQTNALNQARSRKANAIGQLVEVTDNLGTKITYKYDAFGNLVETDVGGVVTTMDYDIRGLKTFMDDPNMGQWFYDHNVLGELTSQTDPKGQSVELFYDTLGRLERRIEPEGTTEWFYDTAAKGIGKLQSVSAPHSGYLETQSYDSLGRPSSTTTTIDGVVYTQSVTYDASGRPETLTYPSGFAVRNSYNARGYLTSVSEEGGATVYWQADSVNAEGQVTQETFGNGVVTSNAFDPKTGLIDGISSTLGATAIQDLAYDFDKLGNLKKRSDLRQGREESFLYDGLNRLTTTTLIDTSAGGATLAASTYAYSDIGNLTFKSDIGALSYGGGGAGPHAVTAADGKTYAYDANGNMTARLDGGGGGGGGGAACTPAINAQMTATEDSYGSSITLAGYAVPDFSNRILVVTTTADAADQDRGLPDSVTFGAGHSLTRADGVNTNISGYSTTASVWYLIDPPAETGDIVVSYADEAGSRGVSAFVLDCVAQQAPEATTTGSGDALGISTSITPLSAGAIVIDATAYNNDGETLTASEAPDQVETYNANVPGGHVHLGSRRLVDPAGSVSLGWDGADLTNRWAQVLVAFAPATAPPPGGGGNAEQTIAWSSFNKPTLVRETASGNEAGFTYGPDRARIKQHVVDSLVTRDVVYIGGLYERRTSFGNPAELVHYIVAGTTVAIHTVYDDDLPATNKTRYLHRDHLGSVDTITGESGAVIERLSFDAHGKRRLADWTAGEPAAASAETPRGFTGHEHLDSVGLIHMNGRVYDPTLGRFLSADPFVQFPAATQGFNRYSYVHNNPLSYTDPSGFGLDSPYGPPGMRGGEDGVSRVGQNVDSWGRDDRSWGERAWDAIVDFFLNNPIGRAFRGAFVGAVMGIPGGPAGMLAGAIGGFVQSAMFSGVTDMLGEAATPDPERQDMNPADYGDGFDDFGREGRDRADGIQIASLDRSVDFPHDGPGPNGLLWNTHTTESVRQLYSRKNEKYHHFYFAHVICHTSDSSCTPSKVFDALRRYPAPGSDGSRMVQTGDETEVMAFFEKYKSAGFVTHEVDAANLTVTNVTKKGHLFHPGYAARSVVESGGWVFVVSHGEGVGDYGTFNEYFARGAFSPLDYMISLQINGGKNWYYNQNIEIYQELTKPFND